MSAVDTTKTPDAPHVALAEWVQLIYESVQDPSNWTTIIAAFLQASERGTPPPIEALIHGAQPLRERGQSPLGAAHALSHVLDALPWGVAFLDTDARILRHNASFSRLAAASPDIEIVDDRLCMKSHNDLHRALSRWARHAPSPSAVSIVNSQLPYAVTLRALDTSGPQPVIMSWWFDKASALTVSHTLFERLYGLTPAESRITALCLQGLTQSDIADELHLSLNTVKTHLKSIYAKTGCKQLAQLIRQLFADLLHAGHETPVAADASLTSPHTIAHRGGRLMLADGRRLSWADSGPADGLPMLIFGPAGVRKTLVPDISDTLHDCAMRAIYIERPGVGDTDPHPAMNDESWLQDIHALIKHLGLVQWLSVGIASGTRESYLIAAQWPSQTLRLQWVSPMLPHGTVALCKGERFSACTLTSRLATFPYGIFRAIGNITLHQIRQQPERYLQRMIERLCASDQAVFNDPAKRAAFSASLLA